MAIRKAVEDTFVVDGARQEWLTRCQNALETQGFVNIEANPTFGEIKATYHKATVWGDLQLTLLPEGTDTTRIQAKAVANVDNVFALRGSPGQKIIERFKAGLR